MMIDIVGAMRALVGFAFILFAPGYLVAISLDLFGFRKRSLLERIAWAIGLSFAISPIIGILLARTTSLEVAQIFFDGCAVAALILFVAGYREISVRFDRDIVALLLFLTFGIAVILASLVDLQQENRLYLSVSVLDQAFRVAFTNGIAHTGIPPLNPLYHPGAAAAMRYYYFWYAICAVCMKIAHVSARQALMASSCWAGLGLVAMIALYSRHFLEVRDRLHRFILVAVLLLTITGLDILPSFYDIFVKHDFGGDVEWWSGDQVTSWFDTILWVPHHTAALLSCLVAFLLVWKTRTAPATRDRIVATILAGAAAASAFGLSIYVAAGFAMLMALWSVELVVRQRDTPTALRSAGTVAVATLLLIPYLREMLGSHSGTAGGSSAGAGHLFQFGVRKIIDPSFITQLPALASVNSRHPILLDQAIRLVLLPPGYVLELGFFGLILILAMRARKSLTPEYALAVWLSLAGVILVSFVRSAVIGNNDFGYRVALIPCFFLLLLAADRMTSAGSKGWLSMLLLVGLAGTGFQALMLRVYLPMHVAAGMRGFKGLPEATYNARSEYGRVADLIPDDAIIQANMVDPANYFNVINMLYSERAMATDGAPDCGAVFGGDPEGCRQTQKAIVDIFAAPAASASEVRARCKALGIGYLAAVPSDPAWQDSSGWVWTLPPVVRDKVLPDVTNVSRGSALRVVQCGTASGSPP